MNKYAKILVVDDEPDSLRLIINMLLELNPEFSIYQVNSAVNAMQIVLNRKPDLIITDWNMPTKSGIDLIADLKNTDSTKDIPVIVVTGFMLETEDLKTAFTSGAVDFIRKPILKIELDARVNSALALFNEHKEKINRKNKELNENTLELLKSQEFIKTIETKFKNFDNLSENNKRLLKEITAEARSYFKTNAWKRFEVSFKATNVNFQKNLLIKFPNLKPRDIKLAALISLGMNTKDIASILYKTNDSVKVARYRLRKKMNLTEKENLEIFLNSI